MSSPNSSDSSSFVSSSFSSVGVAVEGGAGSPAGVDPPSLYLAAEDLDVDIGLGPRRQAWPEIFHMLTHCFSEDIDLIFRDCHLIVRQDEGQVDGGLLREGGHGVGTLLVCG